MIMSNTYDYEDILLNLLTVPGEEVAETLAKFAIMAAKAAAEIDALASALKKERFIERDYDTDYNHRPRYTYKPPYVRAVSLYRYKRNCYK